ncbi:hypothetical protein DH2020_031738 [Rehmannia glutinosa]|uniref:NAC domain-containing protein n=1 Tax=Rehmannia glutinosa TaxID=99300 RepID=A0ABR0VK63_REHGL
MGVRETDPLSQLSLPPGFRFYPTDEELLVQYLCRKVAGHHFSLQIIGDIDLYKFDPWDLPSKAIFGEKEWYFFSPRDRKYPNGSRPNRVAGSGYCKATGTDKIITTQGRKLDEWVLCRIYKKNSSAQKANAVVSGVQSKEYSLGSSSSSSSQYDDVLESLPDINDRFFSLPRMNSLKNLQQLGSGNFDWATLAGLTPLPELGQPEPTLAQHPQGPQQMNNNDMNGQNDMYAPSLQQFGGNANVMDEEVQSGVRAQRVDRPGYFQQNAGLFAPDFSNAFDPFVVRCPTQTGGLGFRQ